MCADDLFSWTPHFAESNDSYQRKSVFRIVTFSEGVRLFICYFVSVYIDATRSVIFWINADLRCKLFFVLILKFHFLKCILLPCAAFTCFAAYLVVLYLQVKLDWLGSYVRNACVFTFFFSGWSCALFMLAFVYTYFLLCIFLK